MKPTLDVEPELAIAGEEALSHTLVAPASQTNETSALEQQVSGVGFYRQDSNLRVIMPKVYRSAINRLGSDADFRCRHVYLLIRALAQYQRDALANAPEHGTRDVRTIRPLEERGRLLERLDAAAELRREYLCNGLYYTKNVRVSPRFQSAPIDWSRTSRRSSHSSKTTICSTANLFGDHVRWITGICSGDFMPVSSPRS